MKLEVVAVPVSDVDRAKDSYEALGWREDADFAAGGDFRVVRLTGACALGPEAGEWLQQATLAIRARIPLSVLRDTIQPFPTFSEIYVDALKALRSQIAGTSQPVSAGSP